MIAGSVFWVLVAPRTGVAVAIAIFLARLISGAHGRYVLAHVVLAARGLLPWRLMRFLDDAQKRGVLRRIGAVHHFRHDRLRGHLAARSAGNEHRE
jgi:hypothetical protein